MRGKVNFKKETLESITTKWRKIMSIRKVRIKMLCSAMAALVGSHVCFSQESRGDILGRVTDPSGAVIAGATVRAVNTATNVQSTTTTNQTGDYVLPFLNPGTYKFSVQAAGFKNYVQEGITVSVLKTTHFSEQGYVEFRAEFINAFNHVQFSSPNASPTSTAFGSIGGLAQFPRVIQFGLRVLF
jgi:hypothetical protein